jgi:hypothetical protein
VKQSDLKEIGKVAQRNILVDRFASGDLFKLRCGETGMSSVRMAPKGTAGLLLCRFLSLPTKSMTCTTIIYSLFLSMTRSTRVLLVIGVLGLFCQKKSKWRMFICNFHPPSVRSHNREKNIFAASKDLIRMQLSKIQQTKTRSRANHEGASAKFGRRH